MKTCWWDGWSVEEAQDNSLPPLPPHFATVRWGGASRIDSPGTPHSCGTRHQWLDRCCRDADLLSLTGWAAPPLRSLGPGSLSFGYIRSRCCRSGWGRLGGWTPARGASGAGLPGGAGLRSLLPPVLCSVARLSLPSSLLCEARTPRTRCSRWPRCFPPGRSPFPRSFRWGGSSGHRRPGRFPVCETAGKLGLAGLTQCWPADVTAAPPHATPPWW